MNNQSVNLAGDGVVGDVTVFSLSGTTLTGAAGPFTGVTAIKLDMKLGDDSATVVGVRITGALTFLGGDGNNTLNVGAGTQSFGSITVTNGDGNDIFDVDGSAVTSNITVSGAVTVNHGDGDDTNSFGETGLTTISFGSLKITSGDGVSQVKAPAGNGTVVCVTADWSVSC